MYIHFYDDSITSIVVFERNQLNEMRNKTLPFEKINVRVTIEEELKKGEFKESYEKLKNKYDFIDQIVNKRVSLNITQTQLARSTKVSQQTISRLEKDRRFPKIDTLMIIIDGLGMKLIIEER